jgi:hypothetical protein
VNNIKINLIKIGHGDVEWIKVAHDKVHWLVVANMTLKCEFLTRQGNS